MTSASVTLLVIAIALIPTAGLFAGVDAAIGYVSVARVAELRRAGARNAAVLERVLVDRPRHNAILLLLRVLCEVFAAVLVTIVLIDVLGSGTAAVLIAGVAMTVVSFVLVGVGPRTIGRQHAYAVAIRTARLTRGLGVAFGPISWGLILLGNAVTPGRGFRDGPFSTEVELRELVDLAEARGVVEHGERNMIHSVFELGDTIAREVMVPRPDIVWIEGTKSARQGLALALRSGFSRVPVIGDNVDDVIGVVYLKDLARRTQRADEPSGAQRIEDLMRPASFVPESKPVDELLREMQARRIHMAVVVDEYGGTAGLVTIEDILEEIVGEITDEYDPEQRAPVEHLADGAVRVTSRLPVDDLAELFDLELPDEDDDIDTVGGLLARELGRVPIPGAQTTYAGLTLTAESIEGRRNRIDTLLVSRIPIETNGVAPEHD